MTGSISSAERQRFRGIKTDRPAEAESPDWLPTVAELLALEVVVAALPEVLAGEENLTRRVRWVHVSDVASLEGLLEGGELLLSTGAGWNDTDEAHWQYVRTLHNVAAAGLILELGGRFPHAPAALVKACRHFGLPLVVFHRIVRFVSITEAVHRRIISQQVVALQAKDHVNEQFVQLGLQGSPPDFVVSELARSLGAAVVLENLNHRVIAADGVSFDDELLADWERRSRAAHSDVGSASSPPADEATSGWLTAPVHVHGRPLGRLIALPGPAHPAGRAVVLRQGAIALTLSALADGDTHDWLSLSERNLLGALIEHRFTSVSGIGARIRAAGLPFGERPITAVALSARHDDGYSVAAARVAATEIGWRSVVADLTVDKRRALVLLISTTDRADLSKPSVDAFIKSYCRVAEVDQRDIVLAIGPEAYKAPEIVVSLQSTMEYLPDVRRARVPGDRVVRVAERPLLELFMSLGDDPRVQRHCERMLGPLVSHDLQHGLGLIGVLEAFLAHPGNRTRAAAASNVSRSVFYLRLRLIEELLGISLDDGEALSALHAAILARRK